MDMRFRDAAVQDRTIERRSDFRRSGWWIALAVGLLLVVAVATIPSLQATISAQRSVSASRLAFSTVERTDLVRDFSVDGRVIPARAPLLYAPSAGAVNLRLHAGDIVSKGDVVAMIDSPELRSKFEQERSALAAAEVEYRRAQILSRKQSAINEQAFERARINLRTARREYERAKKAFDLGAYSELAKLKAQDELEQAEFAMQEAEKGKDLDPQSLAFEVESRKLARDRQRLLVADLQRQVAALEIRSPVSGQIGQLLVAESATVAEGVALVSIIDLSTFELEVKAPESFARDLSVGTSAVISGGGRDWEGIFSAVSPEVVQGQVAARVRFANETPGGIRANQRMSVRAILDRRDAVLAVARGPWVDESGGKFAYVVRDGLAERRPVTLGAMSIDKVEIVAGLGSGEEIVVSGTDIFDNVSPIRISR